MENGSLPIFGVVEMKEDRKGSGWSFPPEPTKSHAPKLGEKGGEKIVLEWNLLFCHLSNVGSDIKYIQPTFLSFHLPSSLPNTHAGNLKHFIFFIHFLVSLFQPPNQTDPKGCIYDCLKKYN